MVDEFLRDGLRRGRSVGKKKGKVVLPVYRMGKPLVNLADRNRLYDVLDGG